MSTSDFRHLKTGDPAAPDVPASLRSGAGPTTKEPEPPQAPAIVIPDLPWAYADDRVVLLVRDPRTLFTYWDFAQETVKQALEAVPGGTAWIRLLMLGGREPQTVTEVEIDLVMRSYYLYELEPNRDYRVEIFLRSLGGAERPLGRPSNVASLPSNRPSTWVEDRFATIPLEVKLPAATLSTTGRLSVDPGLRIHTRSYELSGGEVAAEHTGDVASSSQGIAQGFGGRSWSGTLVRK